jgi:hypothetical protein
MLRQKFCSKSKVTWAGWHLAELAILTKACLRMAVVLMRIGDVPDDLSARLKACGRPDSTDEWRRRRGDITSFGRT